MTPARLVQVALAVVVAVTTGAVLVAYDAQHEPAPTPTTVPEGEPVG